jgi:membrane protein
MRIASIWDLVKTTFSEWLADNATRLGAALAYYTMLSVAPLLVIVTTIAGLIFGQEAAQGQLVQEMTDMVGPQGATAIQAMLKHAYHPTTGIIASIIGVIVLLLGATGVFVELQDSLNTIWGVTTQAAGGVWGFIRTRLLSFVMILVFGFLLLVSLVLSATLAGLGHYLSGAHPTFLFQALNFLVSLAVVTVLFALIFKLLPDVHVSWKDVWIGAIVTGVLFTIGKFLIGLYLGNSSLGSTYGAAGSLAVFLVWVYYSALILFFGAEFSQVYARRYGTHQGDHAKDRLEACKQNLRQGRPQNVGAAAGGQ